MFQYYTDSPYVITVSMMLARTNVALLLTAAIICLYLKDSDAKKANSEGGNTNEGEQLTRYRYALLCLHVY